MNGSPEELLLALSPGSTLLVLLRTLYSLRLDFGVLWPDGSEHAFVFRKDQLVALIGRGRSEALVRDLPDLAREGMIRPVEPEEAEAEGVQALLVERRGGRVLPLSEAVAPWEPQFPEWWEAPLPFAMNARGRMRINRTASLMFGSDLGRLSVAELPEKDEFIVELEGREPPCFLAFRRLESDIFIIEDCTGELLEAQDISWWAAVGRAWTASIEAEGRAWRREETAPPEGFPGRAWPCEWEGRVLGWLYVEESGPQEAPDGGRQDGESQAERAPAPRKKPRARRSAPKREDEVLKAIGPQTMALLAAGQVPEEDPSREGRTAEEEAQVRRSGAKGRGRRP
ncbi:MAG: hypothetical protein Q4A13_01165 [Fretibacterium sp.]|nr:hypothetical protein [Fretibacterium sp.]